ncbi:UNVERIFIED_ORG: hypothetical protein J2X79_000213 [Arthrobacter globiformis]|nr:hypothetical protein [Arthrobacter globiformis]
MPSKVLQARSKVGLASRRGNPEQIREARRELAAAKLEAYVAAVLAEAPPLNREQLDRIAVLLHSDAGNAS